MRTYADHDVHGTFVGTYHNGRYYGTLGTFMSGGPPQHSAGSLYQFTDRSKVSGYDACRVGPDIRSGVRASMWPL